MFALIRFAFSCVIFAIVVWFAVMVPLGKKTLWGHLRAIGGTQEAHEFAEGTKAEATKVAEKLLGRDGGTPPSPPHKASAPPPGVAQEDVGDADRAALDKLTKRPARKK